MNSSLLKEFIGLIGVGKHLLYVHNIFINYALNYTFIKILKNEIRYVKSPLKH